MAFQLTIATICLLLVAQITPIQAPLPAVIAGIGAAVGAATSAQIATAAGVISAGASLAGTTIQALADINYGVTMGMEVENWTKFELMKPHVTVKSGAINTPPVPVRPGQKEAMVARKTSSTATGTYGVVSWEIAGKSRRVVIMWSVPYDYSYYSNWLAVGITKQNVQHDGGWADQMYYYSSNEKLGFDRQEYYHGVPTVEWEAPELGLIVSATMSTTQKAVVKVTFYAKNANDLAKPIRDNLDKNQKKKASPTLHTVDVCII